MATFNQLIRRRRTPPGGRYNRSPKMEGCPQKLGICIRVGTTKPKKPNSAVRKIAKVALATGYNVRAVIPGAGHALVEHNTVLLRAGRARDIPGVHYKLIRNKGDLAAPHGFLRQKRRSKFGVANWLYIFKTKELEPFAVVCRLRTQRQKLQADTGHTVTWGRSARAPLVRG